MHLYCLARGQKDWLDRWVNDLGARYYPYKMKGKEVAVQLGVRPIQLYEIVFPEPCLKDVLGVVQPYGYMGYDMKKYKLLIRKMLKLNKLPEERIPPTNPFMRTHIDCVGLGLRKDRYIEGIEDL